MYNDFYIFTYPTYRLAPIGYSTYWLLYIGCHIFETQHTYWLQQLPNSICFTPIGGQGSSSYKIWASCIKLLACIDNSMENNVLLKLYYD